MADFSCKTQIPDVPGLESGQLTVGRVFTLECTGPWPEGVDPAKLQIASPPPPTDPKQKADQTAKYALKILGAKAISKDVVQFDVTTYLAGKVQIPALILTDGAKSFEANQIDFEVHSVLDPQQPKQEPYGPFGPMPISIPLSWWFMLAGAIVLAGLLVFWRVRRRLQRRELMKKLEEHDSALSPAAEFYTKMRKLRRDHVLFSGGETAETDTALVVRELERMFRTFFMRRFELPALDWNDGTLIRAFKREHRRAAEDVGSDLKKLLKEFGAAKSASRVETKDAVQLADVTRTLVEKIEKLEGKGRG